jgi:hypothetical protein
MLLSATQREHGGGDLSVHMDIYRLIFAAVCLIGRVDSGTQFIVFGAAGMAMPNGRGRRQAAVWAVAMPDNGHAV